MKEKKYELTCPSCGTTFDCKKQLDEWRNELMEKIDKLVEKMKQ